MLPVFTPAQSRSFDERLISGIGMDPLVLMENAARGVLTEMRDWISEDSRVLVYCGVGNNGGDGIALTRLLLSENIETTAVLIGDSAKLSKDAKRQYDILNKLFPKATGSSIDNLLNSVRPTLIIDALLGTGSTGALREPIASIVSQINTYRAHSSAARVLAIDLPTGLPADGGAEESANIIKADRTVTMAAPKIGFYEGHSKSFTGDVRAVSLGAPASFDRLEGDRAYLVQKSDVAKNLISPEDTASKFTRGRVLALCGSRGMTGAAIMAATSALRSGCGLINVAVPKSERSLVAQAMPELLTVGCNEQEDGAPDLSAWDELQEHIDRADTLLIGSGLRPWKGTTELLLKIIEEVDKPMVIDAGALGALVGHLEILKKRKSSTILTPHSGEIARLVERPWQEVDRERLKVAREIATKYGVVVAMKGAPTYTVDRDGTAYINSTGNAGLATAGSGDVLAGIMAAMLVQHRDKPAIASMLGVYIHGLAGDIAAREKTKIGMTATDVTHMLPLAFKALGAS